MKLSVIFDCQICGTRIEADESCALNNIVECPNCHNVIMIPESNIYPGMMIENYRLEKIIGEGQTSIIWKATDTVSSKKLIMKVLSPAFFSEPELGSRFMREIDIISRMAHPNIVKSVNAGVFNGIFYIAFPYVEGELLKDRILRVGRLTEQQALRIAKDIASAMDYVWKNFNVLHRNIKPSNIIITPDGKSLLTDFGLCKEPNESIEMTRKGIIMGTPSYMSPERARLDDKLDCRSDIYSLGAVIYHMIAGKAPFEGLPLRTILSMQVKGILDAPEKYNRSLSAPFSAFMKIIMAKDKDARYGSWEMVISDIDNVMNGKMPSLQIPSETRTENLPVEDDDLSMRKILTAPPKAKFSRKNAVKSFCVNDKPAPFFTVGRIIFLAVILAMLFFASVVMVTKYRADSQIKGSSTSKSQVLANAENGIDIKNETLLREKWNAAVLAVREIYLSSNDFDAGISGFEKIKNDFQGTKYEERADAEIENLKRKKEVEVRQVMDELRRLSNALLDQKKFPQAAEVYNSYSGKYSKDTLSERAALAEACIAKANASKIQVKTETKKE